LLACQNQPVAFDLSIFSAENPGCLARVFLWRVTYWTSESENGGACLNTNDLKYYLAICQERSFAQAAKRLFLTQQGVGKIMKRLEDELGVTLLLRTPAGIEPTACGRLLEQRAQYIVDYLESMEREFQEIAWSDQGVIRLASAYGI